MKTIKRRRKENRTNYQKRINLLKSRLPRLVFRKTNKYLIVQYVVSNGAQDSIKMGKNSKQLLKYGWPKEAINSLKSTPASYLLGFLSGKEIQKEKLDTPIIDFGLQRVIKGTKLHAFIKGLIDSGLDIKSKKEAFPNEERILGKHMEKKLPVAEIKLKISKEK
jgi:large subunit ribosomal protein L18